MSYKYTCTLRIEMLWCGTYIENNVKNTNYYTSEPSVICDFFFFLLLFYRRRGVK